VPGVDSVAACLWGRFLFHLGSAAEWSALSGFSHTGAWPSRMRCDEWAGRLVESKCRCQR
jgi:hypothetical protein